MQMLASTLNHTCASPISSACVGNVLIDADGSAVLADFGFCRKAEVDHTGHVFTSTAPGSPVCKWVWWRWGAGWLRLCPEWCSAQNPPCSPPSCGASPPPNPSRILRRAPEMMAPGPDGRFCLSGKADVWSFGITLSQLLTTNCWAPYVGRPLVDDICKQVRSLRSTPPANARHGESH